MPAPISPAQATGEILHGGARGRFEIQVPKRFTRWMKALGLPSDRWQVQAIHRGTGL